MNENTLVKRDPAALSVEEITGSLTDQDLDLVAGGRRPCRPRVEEEPL